MSHHRPTNRLPISGVPLHRGREYENFTGKSAVHWPSRFEALYNVTRISSYEEWMADSCFYNSEDFGNFRMNKFMEDHHPNECEKSGTDGSEEYEEIIEEETEHSEYEEIIEEAETSEELSIKPSM